VVEAGVGTHTECQWQSLARSSICEGLRSLSVLAEHRERALRSMERMEPQVVREEAPQSHSDSTKVLLCRRGACRRKEAMEEAQEARQIQPHQQVDHVHLAIQVNPEGVVLYQAQKVK